MRSRPGWTVGARVLTGFVLLIAVLAAGTMTGGAQVAESCAQEVPAATDGRLTIDQPIIAPGGTGLGLALVRTIVRAHRGTVRIEPAEEGPGTVFRLRFPLYRAAPAAVLPAPTASTQPEAHVTS